VAGGPGLWFRSAPCRLALCQLQQQRIVDAAVGERVLAESELSAELLAYRGRQSLEPLRYQLRRLMAETLLQFGRAFGRQPGVQGEQAADHLGLVAYAGKLIQSDRDEAGHHRHAAVLAS
jgi:hypothetical protein